LGERRPKTYHSNKTLAKGEDLGGLESHGRKGSTGPEVPPPFRLGCRRRGYPGDKASQTEKHLKNELYENEEKGRSFWKKSKNPKGEVLKRGG